MSTFIWTKPFKLIFVISILIILSSCESEKLPEVNVPENISLSMDVQPTFNDRCISCHNGTTPPDLTSENAYFDLSSGNYLDLDNPSNSLLYTKISGSGSMASKSNDYQRAIILGWIEQGALEN